MTAPEAARAARRLYRFALGRTFTGRVIVTRGNRRSWLIGNTLKVNPEHGWRELVHDLSHDFVYRENPGERPHSKFHARFEAKLAREVVRRGWLDGKLRDKVPAQSGEPARSSLADRQRDTLSRIDASIERWEKKHKRATRALAKLANRRRYYAKALGVA
jgi:hypothetical protein